MTTTSDLTTGGRVRPITRWGSPVMHTPTEPVTVFDDALRELARDMFATMEAAAGVGLAATQVGVGISMFVFDCPDADDERHVGVVCNPVVELPSGKERRLEVADEGCLSLPGAYAELARPDHAICRGQDAYGNDVEIVGTGLLARCLQHETDHLNGIVFGDRLRGKLRKGLYAAHEETADRYPADWPVQDREPVEGS
ncbi:peptide deformylase [Naumannella halotolerans]|nr:peptide deformylase [Naumannella halotolerans]